MLKVGGIYPYDKSPYPAPLPAVGAGGVWIAGMTGRLAGITHQSPPPTVIPAPFGKLRAESRTPVYPGVAMGRGGVNKDEGWMPAFAGMTE